MRSVVLVILTCVALIGAFLAYTGFSKRHVTGGAGTASTVQPAPLFVPMKPTDPMIRPGKGSWYEIYNDDGTLKNRFRAEEYLPQPDGTVKVIQPVAEFFMPNHQLMRLTGDTGDIEMPGGGASAADGPHLGAPSRGQIHHCTIDLFNLFPDSISGVADETITMDNAQFDNQTMLISTETFRDAAGNDISADNVPVKMRGKKYDFDGRGLILRWNEKDGRLELLEIRHGEQLVVKDASGMSGTLHGPGGAGPTSRAAAGASVAVAMADAGKSTAAEAPSPASDVAKAPLPLPTSAPAKTKNNVPVPYVAIFQNDVDVTQGTEIHVTGDQMAVSFATRKESAGPTTTPAGGGANGSSKSAGAKSDDHPSPPAPAPKDAGALAANSPVNPVTPQGKPLTTQPASAPVVIRWTGVLHLAPANAAQEKAPPGDAIVQLTGRPVRVRRMPANQQQGDDVQASRIVYHTADGSAKLFNSAALPEVVISKLVDGKIDPKTRVTTATLDYGADGKGRKFALLGGAGHAAVPLQQSGPAGAAARASPMMDARWKKSAKIYFAGKGQNEQTVEHIDLAGDVDILHPQLAMKAQALSLFFQPPAQPESSAAADHSADQGMSQAELRRVTAKESVHCDLTGQAGKKQTIDCQNLEMLTARSEDKKIYARQVNASGAVHAFDGDQDLRAGVVELTLKPARQKVDPNDDSMDPPDADAVIAAAGASDGSDTAGAELETMIARDQVRVTNKEGSHATGSEMIITTENDTPHVRLSGLPLATVMDVKKNVVAGPLITVEPSAGIAHVIGDGNMHMLQESAAGAKPRPMDVAWLDRADMNGPGDRVDVLGSVIVKTYDVDGTCNTATGDRVRIDLKKKPVPATMPGEAAATRPTSRPARAQDVSAMKMDIMKDKEVAAVTIQGHGKVESSLLATNGAVLKQFLLSAPKIVYNLIGADGTISRTMIVPSAGQMLVRDHRPSEKSAEPAPGKRASDDESSSRGDTAFQWKKKLVYSEIERRAVMTGDVVIVHQPDGKESADGPVRINADEVTAYFQPQPANDQGAAATRPAGPADQRAMQLKRLKADGHIVVTRSASTLVAEKIDYDPRTHWMAAHGSDDQLASFEDPDPKRSLTAKDMEWNTQTWNIRMTGAQISNPK